MLLWIKATQFSTLKDWVLNLHFSVIYCLRQVIFNRKGIVSDKQFSIKPNIFLLTGSSSSTVCSMLGCYFSNAQVFQGITQLKPSQPFPIQPQSLPWGTEEVPEGSGYYGVTSELMQKYTQSLTARLLWLFFLQITTKAE